MLTGIFPKELVLFPFFLNYSVLNMNIYCLYYGHFFTEFQSLTDYFHFEPKFYLKVSFFMPFRVSLIQQLEILRIYQFSKYIKARMNCSFLLFKK